MDQVDRLATTRKEHMNQNSFNMVDKALGNLQVFYFKNLRFKNWKAVAELRGAFSRISNNKPAVKAWALKARKVISAL